MTALPIHLADAFRTAAAELGMCSAARLFVRELSRLGGDALVESALDTLGRTYPVLDFVAYRFLQGARDFRVDVSPVRHALADTTRLLVVGLEADFLDALVPALDGVAIGMVTEASGLDPDLRRVLANYAGAIEAVSLSDVQRWAGRRSALLGFVYGSDGHAAHVTSTWLRVTGPDVRTQFRKLVGWDVLGMPMRVHPRWLVETESAEFSRLIGPEAAGGAPPAFA